jgi:YgiT-type zinc finger domain-containing protein
VRCVVCNGLDIQMKTVEEEIRSGNDIFLFPMDVLVCPSCGERYYDRKAMKKIEKMRSKIKEKNLEAIEVGRILRVQTA